MGSSFSVLEVKRDTTSNIKGLERRRRRTKHDEGGKTTMKKKEEEDANAEKK
jgi:hypothetical protein